MIGASAGGHYDYTYNVSEVAAAGLTYAPAATSYSHTTPTYYTTGTERYVTEDTDGVMVESYVQPSSHRPPQQHAAHPTTHLEEQLEEGYESPRNDVHEEHMANLNNMRRQFQILERAFLTLEGLCKTEIQAIEDEQRRMMRRWHSSLTRYHEQRVQQGLVKLNVGGVRFNVSHTNLTKFPGSLFEMLLNSQFPVERDEKNYIFIDRDPNYFREILHFLRTGDSSAIRAQPPDVKSRIVDEAKYYGLDQLVMELRSTRLEWVSESLCRSVSGDVPAARCFASAQYIGHGQVFLFGGCTANDTFFDSLYRIQIFPTDALLEGGGGNGADGVDPSNSPHIPMSYIGAGGGTTSQQLYLSNASPLHNATSFGSSNNNGDGNENATGAFGLEGVNGASSSMSSSAAAAAFQTSQRPERFEFSLIRGRGDICPPARSGHCMVHLNGHLILLFGNDKSGHVNELYSFSVYTLSWSILASCGDFVEPRSGHSVTVLHDKLWLIGGKQIFPTMRTYNEIFEGTVNFEAETVTWRLVRPAAVYPEGSIVEKRGYHSAVAHGDEIIIHGGIVRDVYCHDVCSYDVVRNVWKSFQVGDPAGYIPSVPRSGHIAVVHRDEMFVFGSYSEDHPSMLLYSFCLRSFQWRRVQVTGKGPARRAAPSGVLLPYDASTALLPRLLLFGGFDISTRRCFNDVFTITL